MSEKLQYVGWGLVGTPKGRQQTADGVDKQLNLAPSFDLEQQFGGCLPEPKTKDFTPLYRLSFQQKGQYAVLGMAEYRPIYEQGQTRAGTYFGAFIELVHHTFNEAQSQMVLETLFEMSQYQTQHFIDVQTTSYKEALNGKTFEAPQAALLQIAEQMQPLAANYLSQTAMEETLYIACDKSQAVETLVLLLQQQLYYRFRQIFFSESTHISQQMQGKKVAFLTFSQLKAGSFHLNGWKEEVRYLRSLVTQAQTEQQQLHKQLKQEREQQNQMVEAQLKNKMGEVNQQIEQYRQAAENAERRANQNANAAQFGEQVYQLISQNAAHLGNGELAKYATSNPLSAEIGNLRATVNDVRAHLSNLSQQAMQEPNVITKTSVWTFIFGGLSALFGLILIAMLVMSGFSNDVTITEAEKETFDRLQSEVAGHQNAIQEKQSQIDNLNKQIKELQSGNQNTVSDLQKKLDTLCKVKSVKDSLECKK